MNRKSVVVLDQLTFYYGNRKIIKKLDLSVKKGQVVAIMGGSGVGKTTLLKLISGLQVPTSGHVKVFEKIVSNLKVVELNELRKRLGLLFQFGALFTDLSCFENVAFPLREHSKLPENHIRDIVHLKLEAVGLRGAASLMPSEISGGMARRVALARAVALDPELILYDEPFAGLDPISLAVTANLIKSLNRALGATSIIVTHDVAETFEIADEVFILSASDKGSILVAKGTPEELMKEKDAFVRQFLQGNIEGPIKFHFPVSPISQILK